MIFWEIDKIKSNFPGFQIFFNWMLFKIDTFENLKKEKNIKKTLQI